MNFLPTGTPLFDAPLVGMPDFHGGWVVLLAGLLTVLLGGRAVIRAVRSTKTAYIVSAVGLLTTVLGGGTVMHSELTAASVVTERHAETIEGWLADEYGVNVSTELVAELLAGEPVAVNYNSRVTDLILTRTPVNTIIVSDLSGTPLVPVS